MVTRHQLTAVAKKLKMQLNGKAFLTLPRMQITDLLRTTSGEDGTRIKSTMAAELETALLEQGLRCYPSLANTSTGDTVRLFHAGTILGNLVDLVIHPSPEADRDLGAMLTKLKGQWEWSTTD